MAELHVDSSEEDAVDVSSTPPRKRQVDIIVQE
jgi:hypothetical protein